MEVTMEEEKKWIEEVRAGNMQAFTKIIDKYKNQLFATVLRMTKNPEDAQDLVQEAFIKVYEQLNKYDFKGSFSSWLYRVTINHCLDELRKKRYQVEHITFNEKGIDSSEENEPEIVFLKKEKSRQLEKLIASLPEDERMIILLRYANERSYEEISELLHIPLSTVRNKLHRAKKKLRKIVQAEKGGYFNEVYERR